LDNFKVPKQLKYLAKTLALNNNGSEFKDLFAVLNMYYVGLTS